MTGIKPKRKMPLGKRFQKGQVANPLGGKAHDPVKRAIKALTSQQILDASLLLSQYTIKELKQMLFDGELPAMQATLVTLLVDAHDKKEMGKTEFIMDRLIGPVATKTELTGKNGAPLIPSRSAEERAAELAQIAALKAKLLNGKS